MARRQVSKGSRAAAAGEPESVTAPSAPTVARRPVRSMSHVTVKVTGLPSVLVPLPLSATGSGWAGPVAVLPADLPFLEVAVAGRAEALVTGNLRPFSAAEAFLGRPAESPADFIGRLQLAPKIAP